ncbi:MAG: DegT/DnrJ/EryC1/StrS family aminotransferase [bacterium]|nr:DegT/DnrJ/EryC1/StrS family aminotransferase [bacterium]
MIPQTDPKAGYLAHKTEINEAIHRILDSGRYILGTEVTAFEKEFAAYVGANHAVGVASGTDALELALRALSIGPGDSVVTVSHTAVATVVAIERCGATPVLVDIDPATYTMDPQRLEDTIRKMRGLSDSLPAIRAVIAVHLYGCPVDVSAIEQITAQYGVYLIEDCAQAHGAAITGRKVGTYGDLAAFSFYPTKNLGALGDGGAVVTNSSELFSKLKALREYGFQERYVSSIKGINSRLDELQAAVLRIKLRYLDEDNTRRRDLAKIYHEHLADGKLNLPIVGNKNIKHVYHQYVVRSIDRDSLRRFLDANGVTTAVHYPQPAHLQPAYERCIAQGYGGLSYTEAACREIVSLPMHPHMADETARYVATKVNQWITKA